MGASDGDLVRSRVDAKDGSREGNIDGNRVGHPRGGKNMSKFGLFDGKKVGSPIGNSEGLCADDTNVGISDGFNDGTSVGELEG